MSKLHVRHVREALERDFLDKVNLSDYENASASQREKVFLTRALAALAVQRFTDLDPEQAAKTVVDGTGDNGIDAIYLDEPRSRVILVQSKWDGSGAKTFGLSDARNFCGGFKDLTNENYQRFNTKLSSRQEEISALIGDPYVTFLLVVATTGETNLATPVQEVLNDTLKEVNDPQPIADVELLGLSEFHAMIAEGLNGPRIDIDVTVENWGTITEPYEAYYGVVSASVISDWYEQHADRLFSQNIRNALGPKTAVNKALIDTLTDQGQHFWYFNNGVTILCDKIKKKARGASTRTYGDFVLSGASVVNGAQTVASIHNATRTMSANELENARVWVRFISLEGCPKDFATDVTRATNTQNTVENSDFVSLDPEQGRLRTELLLSLQKTYSIKRGDQPPTEETGCTVPEATIALACANRDPDYAVQAKSSIGRLWDFPDRPYYKTLFNPSITAYRLWRSVITLRAVEAELARQRRQREGRPRSVAVQGNRIILHLVFRMLDLARIDDPDFDWDRQLEDIPSFTIKALESLTFHVESVYASNYITSLFKNSARCRDLVEKTRDDLSI